MVDTRLCVPFGIWPYVLLIRSSRPLGYYVVHQIRTQRKICAWILFDLYVCAAVVAGGLPHIYAVLGNRKMPNNRAVP